MATLGFAAEPDPSHIEVPPAPEILARVHHVHPRLLASSEDFARLKERVASDAQLQIWHKALEAEGERILKAAPSRYEIPDGLRLLATSRRVVERTQTLGLLYQLDGQPRYAQRGWEELEAAAHFPDWNTRHFLDTAEMTHAFAIGYDWFYDAWTREQRAILERAMLEKGLQPALALYRKHAYWTVMRHNWNQVCNGGIAMGALALAEVQPEVCGEILHSALESIQLAMAEFAPDGAWKEGPGYWNYATSYNVLFLAGIRSALGTDFGLSEMRGFAETGLFPIYLTGPLGKTFNYADGGDHRIQAPQMFWLARRFEQPRLAAYQRRNAAPGALDLLWFEPGDSGSASASVPLDKYFRGAEVVTLRSAWEDRKALFAGFKAGDNKANHSHLDLGSFVFDAMGQRWAEDLGADDYNLPAYFGRERWTYYRLRAEGHNTLVLNPGAGPDQDPRASARILRFQSKPERASAVADLTAAYTNQAAKVWRGLALLDRNKLLIQDQVQAEKPADLWWFMHTRAAVKIEPGGREAVLELGGARLRATILSPQIEIFQVVEAQPLPESPHRLKQAENGNVRKLAIHLSGVTDLRLAVVLLPLGSDGSSAPAVKLTDLGEW